MIADIDHGVRLEEALSRGPSSGILLAAEEGLRLTSWASGDTIPPLWWRWLGSGSTSSNPLSSRTESGANSNPR
jgi:hypothetical protein